VYIEGIGQDGTPASGAEDIHEGYRTYQTLHFINNGVEGSNPPTDQGWTESPSVPSDYCTSHSFDGPTFEYWYCYDFVYEPHDLGDYVPPTTGSATTAIGKTFPGGVGAPAARTNYVNVPITPGVTYPISVAAGTVTFHWE
jgi:hypothetical protein